jgi:hypothetical protein
MCYVSCVCEEDWIAKEVVDAAVKLHKHFGPGVYETVYEPVLLHELKKRNLTTRHQIPVPLVYEGLTFDVAFKMDWRSLLGVRSLMPRPRLCVKF